MFTSNGKIRADGLMEHEMYIMQVKKPDESRYPWDYYKLVLTMSGEQAFGKLSDLACPLGTHLAQSLDAKARPVPTGRALHIFGINRFPARRKMR